MESEIRLLRVEQALRTLAVELSSINKHLEVNMEKRKPGRYSGEKSLPIRINRDLLARIENNLEPGQDTRDFIEDLIKKYVEEQKHYYLKHERKGQNGN